MYKFVLFVTGNQGNSTLARMNLKIICETHLDQPYEVREVDVLNDFQTALDRGILVTPSLIIESSEPKITIMGNLNDSSKLLNALGLPPKREENG
ncbi:circadian clock KaiB family protein [Desulfobacterales bacterium HSG17]|nr:circadian clock KaiB family protein [Desulfobacterales bacterium HSG17]